MTRYENQWKTAVFRIEPGSSTVESFVPLIKAAVEKIIGKK